MGAIETGGFFASEKSLHILCQSHELQLSFPLPLYFIQSYYIYTNQNEVCHRTCTCRLCRCLRPTSPGTREYLYFIVHIILTLFQMNKELMISQISIHVMPWCTVMNKLKLVLQICYKINRPPRPSTPSRRLHPSNTYHASPPTTLPHLEKPPRELPEDLPSVSRLTLREPFTPLVINAPQ